MSRLSLRFYTVATFVGFGILWASGICLGLIGFTGIPADCLSSCLAGAASDLVGWILILICGYRALLGYLAVAGVNLSKRPEQSEFGSTHEDSQILETAREVISRIRIRPSRPIETLVWSDRQAWYAASLRRAGLRKPSRLVLAAGLRGRLDIDDWRTLLGYYFEQYRVVRYVLRGLGVVWLLMAVALGVGATLSFTLGRYFAFLYQAVFGPPLLLLVLLQLGPAIRRTLLRADSAMSETLGSGKLLACFEKIDKLQLYEVESTKRRERWVARLWPIPNISKRIENLSNR